MGFREHIKVYLREEIQSISGRRLKIIQGGDKRCFSEEIEIVSGRG